MLSLDLEKTGLVINDESIDEFGISFGLGIPAGGLFSNVNTTFEFGKRGTTNENLVEENFVNIHDLYDLRFDQVWAEEAPSRFELLANPFPAYMSLNSNAR